MNVKICITCREIKHCNMFYKNKKSKDGYGSSCRNCLKKYFSKRRKLASYKIKNKEYKHKYYLKNKDKTWYKEKHNEYAKRYSINNHLKVYARDVVRNDVRHGRLSKKPCEICGSIKVHAHHNDYAKPREVQWLCLQHHVEVHYGDLT